MCSLKNVSFMFTSEGFLPRAAMSCSVLPVAGAPIITAEPLVLSWVINLLTTGRWLTVSLAVISRVWIPRRVIAIVTTVLFLTWSAPRMTEPRSGGVEVTGVEEVGVEVLADSVLTGDFFFALGRGTRLEDSGADVE